jgi:alkylation response protein AidB-like acyl-CoA dehydrogenase
MLTSPLAAAQDVEIEQMVRAFCRTTFSSARVRETALSVSGMDELAWKQMVELGWSGLAVSTEFGGAGLGSVAECMVLRELGARLAPTPYLGATAFPVAALATLVTSEGGSDMLGAIATEPQGVALALGIGRAWDFAAEPTVRARKDDLGWVLDGCVPLVPDAARAARLLVVAALGESDKWGLFTVNNDTGVFARTRPTVDTTRRFADVTFSHSTAVLLSGGDLVADDISRLVDRLAICVAAELVGVGIACQGRTLEYLNTREQFGRAIGSFQALKHRCADLAVALTTAQEIVFAAAALVDVRRDVNVAAPLAVARAGEAAKRNAEEAIQMHGGVGFTEEFDLGMYYRRVIADLELISTPADAYLRMQAARAVIA